MAKPQVSDKESSRFLVEKKKLEAKLLSIQKEQSDLREHIRQRMAQLKESSQRQKKVWSFAQKISGAVDSVEVFRHLKDFLVGVNGRCFLVFQPWNRPLTMIEISRNWREKEVPGAEKLSQTWLTGIHVDDFHLSAEISKFIGAAVGPVGKYPLPVRRLFLEPCLGAFIAVERQYAPNALDQESLLQAISMSSQMVDSLETFFELKIETSRWQKIFSKIQIPIAILGESLEINYSNPFFEQLQKNFDLGPVFEAARGLVEPKGSLREKNSKEFSLFLASRFKAQSWMKYRVQISQILSDTIKIRPKFLLTLNAESDSPNSISLAFRSQRDELFGQIRERMEPLLSRPLTELEQQFEQLAKVAKSQLEEAAHEQLLKDLAIMRTGRARSKEVIDGLRSFFFQSTDGLHSNLWQVLEEISAEVFNQNFQFVLDTREPAPESAFIVRIQPILLKQAIKNLFINARESMEALKSKGLELNDLEAKTMQIFVEVWREKGLAFCRVRDSGKGIPHDLVDKIFEPYFSFQKSVGTGLGLSFVKRVLESVNGGVFVESPASESPPGASFVFFLPQV